LFETVSLMADVKHLSQFKYIGAAQKFIIIIRLFLHHTICNFEQFIMC